MNKISIISSVEDGNLKRNRTLIKDAIASFEGRTINLTIEKATKKRSTLQNSYYWGVVVPIVQAGIKDVSGEVRGANAIHYNLLLPLLSDERDIVNIYTGEVVQEKITSSEMTTTEFCHYITKIQEWAAHYLGVQIPDPNEDLKLEI